MPAPPTHDHLPNGRFALLLGGGQQQGQSTWKRTNNEELPQTLADLLHEVRAAEAERTRTAREEAQARRRRDWQTAMTTATLRAVNAHRVSVPETQLGAWERSKRSDAYLTELRVAVDEMQNVPQKEAAQIWLDWVQATATRATPCNNGSRCHPTRTSPPNTSARTWAAGTPTDPRAAPEPGASGSRRHLDCRPVARGDVPRGGGDRRPITPLGVTDEGMSA